MRFSADASRLSRLLALSLVVLTAGLASCSNPPTGAAARTAACSSIDRANRGEEALRRDPSKANADLQSELRTLFLDTVSNGKRSNDQSLRTAAKAMERSIADKDFEEVVRRQKEISSLCGVAMLGSPSTTPNP